MSFKFINKKRIAMASIAQYHYRASGPVSQHLVRYPTPGDITSYFNFGFISGVLLTFQIISGAFLAIYYNPDPLFAFDSIQDVVRDVPFGWIFRYVHTNGASLFFIAVYIHMFRGIFYGSFIRPKQKIWLSGLVIYLLMMAIAFFGYVLPWGQMSFWGATVITGLFSAIPVFGTDLATLILGSSTVGAVTLYRFFILHIILPFVLLAIVGLHIYFVHQEGTSSPMVDESFYIFFHSYFLLKDLFSILVVLIIFCLIILIDPHLFDHPDNYIPANPLVTPAHIVPEWYYLPFYAILRSVPNKFIGVVLMFGAIFILVTIPYTTKELPIKNGKRSPVFILAFWFLVASCVLLGFVGGQVPEEPYVGIGMFCTCYYFFFFCVLLPNAQKISDWIFKHVDKTKSADNK